MSERSSTMKIYLFDPESGVYQGEDFADDLPMRPGRNMLPPYATTIAPPPYGRGEVPVFIYAEHQWKILPVSDAMVRGAG
jgi:hypothetical protein